MSRYWVFTFNNYTEDDVIRLSSKIENLDYIVFGKEIGNSGNKHLQGYCEVKSNKTLKTIKLLLGSETIHCEETKARNKNHAINYCKKGEQSHEEWEKMRTDGPNFGKNADFVEKIWKPKCQGQRTDLTKYHMINDMAKTNKSFSEIADFNPEIAIKFHSGIKTLINEHKIHHQKSSLQEYMNQYTLLDWQERLRIELSGKPHNRKIIWYIDEEGGCGKSIMTKWLYANTDCTMFNNAKTADIAAAWNGEQIVIFDLARCLNGDMINFQAIESLKNGMIFSSKYNSHTKVFNQPHVVIFANWPPTNLEALSKDRWDIRSLNKNKDGPKT